VDRTGRSCARGCQTREGWGKQTTFQQNASISETEGDTYKVTINDEVYSPHRQYGQYVDLQTNTD